jgi:hypothetical protein
MRYTLPYCCLTKNLLLILSFIALNTANAFTQPTNDECAGAVTVPVTTTPSFPTAYTTLGATQSLPGCFGTAEDDIWFKFTATTVRHRIWITNVNDALNPVVEVFSGTCTALTSLGCFYTNEANPASLNLDLNNLIAGNTYYYRVYGKSASSVRTDIRTSVVPLPNVPAIVSSGPTTFCEGGNVVLTSTSSLYNRWYKNGGFITGATAQAYTVTESGSYTVSYNDNVNEIFSTAVNVVVNPKPVQPAVSLSGNMLVSSSPNGNQWLFNSAPIAGANEQVYVANKTGIYSVQVTQNGCSIFSDMVNFVMTLVSNLSPLDMEVTVFPNPTTDKIHIRKQSAHKLSVQIFDVNGRKIYETQFVTSIGIPVRELTNGIYLIVLTDFNSGNRTTKAILKQ